jgi:phage/plasmid primase-like uncharacterized protein
MMETLQQHMQAHIGVSIENPVIDGTWHNGRGKGKDKIGYVGHYLPKGLLVRYHNHKTDEIHVWKEWESGQGEYIDPLEYRRKREEAQAKADAAAQQSGRDRAALLAILQTVITESVPADHNHSYPLGKRILALAARQATKRYELVPATTDTKAQYITPNDCLIPVYSHTGALQGIQQITTNGNKLMRGTFRDGLLWIGGGLSTGEAPNRLYVSEGWATGVAVHMRTRNPVIVAFATSNLMSAGRWARDRYPEAEIVYAVDNDTESFITVAGQRINNPGKYYATKAAEAINAAVITPPLSGDWCDWHTAQITDEKKPDKLAA